MSERKGDAMLGCGTDHVEIWATAGDPENSLYARLGKGLCPHLRQLTAHSAALVNPSVLSNHAASICSPRRGALIICDARVSLNLIGDPTICT